MSERQTVRDLAKWVLALKPEAVAPAVVQQTKLLILDTIGCALAALKEHEPAAAAAAVGGLGGAPQATIIGLPDKTSAVNAVLANGILARHLDLNDFFVGAGKQGPTIGGHPSDNIVVALAVGEWKQRPGRDIIAATVLGYELYSRLKGLHNRKTPWDGTSMSGLVSAAMAGRLLGLDAGRMAHALALAAARCITPGIVRSGDISAAKFLANPLNAQSGTLAAVLAAAGMTGPLAVLDEQEEGVRSLFRMDADLSEMTLPMSGPPAILKANIKSYPCLATGQGEAAAAIEMAKALKGVTADIERIDVIMADYPFIRRQQDDQARRFPHSREAADHSFYFIAAVAILDGELTPRQFDKERWTDPKVTGLMQKITMQSDQALNARAPEGYPCAIRVVRKGGAEHLTEVGYAPGYSTDQGLNPDVVAQKFEAVTRKALNDNRRQAVKDAVDGLDGAASVSALMGLVGR